MEFDCQTGYPKCIPHLWVCDGESDCGNNKDESTVTCDQSTNLTTWTYRQGECGGNFTTMHGIFTSPEYPNKYPVNTECIYTVALRHGFLILLNLIRIELDSQGDYLEARDGPSEASPLLGRISGSEQHQAFIQSGQNHIWLK